MTIRQSIAAVLSRLQRFARAREATAAVEFALILPVMLALYVGAIELSDLINVDRRVTVVAATVGDLVSRADGTLAQADINDYFTAAEEILTPYKATGLKQLITSVKISADGNTATVVWSRQSGATLKAANLNVTSLVPAAVRNLAKNKWVIMSETSYSYKPLMGIMFQNAVTLYRQNFHLPRFGEEIKAPT